FYSRCTRFSFSAPRVIPRFRQLLKFSKSIRSNWVNMSSLKAKQLRPGMVINHENELYTVFSTDHRTPGNKRGSMQTRLKSLRTGTMIDYRFRAEEFVERAILDEI